jgi:uncharacterized protein YcfJ
MKTTRLITAGILAATLFSPAFAGPHPHYDDDRGKAYPLKARVLHAKPIYRTVEVVVPERHCRPSRQAHHGKHRDRDEVIGTLVGGVVGGLLGNQVGKGSGRTVMTVAGTAIGAVIGNRLASDDDRHRYADRCKTIDRVEKRDEVVGYRVKYRHRGQIYHTRTRHDPGKWIRIDRPAHDMRF